MILVLILNFGYHFSMYVLPITMLAMAVVLVVPSMRRLGTALISERAVPPEARSDLFAGRRNNQFAAVFGFVVLFAVLWVNVRTNVEASRRRVGPLPPLYGAYVTETVDPIGGTGMRALDDQSRWQWVTVDAVGPFVRMNTDGFITIASSGRSNHFNYRADTSRRTLTLIPVGNAAAPHPVWVYSAPDSGSLILVGAMDGDRDSVRITLRRRKLDSFPLLQSPPSVVRRVTR
jgi:hypothetical protein